ncbi:MAG TPA: hypothetical protein VFA26_01305 [Gemmataceae bacterium]|nr:hypothetical protein [Gemmataceae bacterium]
MLATPLADLALPPWEVVVIPVIGLLTAGTALVVGRVLIQRRAARVPPAPPAPAPSGSRDPFVHGSALEKRTALRRAGNPVQVLISDEEAAEPPVAGWVLDRSTGGLRLSVFDPMECGTVLSVKPKCAADTIPWIKLEVRSCRKEASGWVLGCQFVRTPPWSVLLTFG